MTSSDLPGTQINCSLSSGTATGTCSVQFSDGDHNGLHNLTATPAQGSSFAGWTGCAPSSSGTNCVLSYNSETDVTLSVTAKFDPQPVPPTNVTVQVSGTGSGTGQVTSTELPGAQIACTLTAGAASGTCSRTFTDPDHAGSFSLTAVPAQGSTFAGWTGCGQGTSGTTCALSYNSQNDVTLAVTAKFDLQSAPPVGLGPNEFIAFDNDPDGDQDDGGGPLRPDIWVAHTNGLTRLTTHSGGGGESEPRWSPDGNRLVFRSKRNDVVFGDIWIMNADGSGQALIPNAASSDYDHDPAWSSTNRIVFVSYRTGWDELFLVNPDGSGFQQLTTTPGEDELEPAWSPDGSKIAYVLDNGSGTTRIFVLTAANPQARTQLTNAGAEDEDPAWSPDGTRILFTRNNQVWVMNADGSGQTQLTFSGDHGDPVWSPDGTRIAFSRRSGGSKHIYVVPVNNPGGAAAQLTSLPGESENISWVRRP